MTLDRSVGGAGAFACHVFNLAGGSACPTVLLVLFGAIAFGQPTLKVRLKPSANSPIIDMPVERYVAAVVAGESGTFRSDEALKAMAVAARSYGLHFRGRHSKEGYDLCGSTHCQRIVPEAIRPRIEAAVQATAGEVVWYEGKPIFAVYSADCGGITEDASSVWSSLFLPFLSSHVDPYCRRKAAPAWIWSATPQQIADALRKSELRVPAQMSSLAVARKTSSGRARELVLIAGGETIRLAASSFRFAIGRALGFKTIRSDRWEAVSAGGIIEFRGGGEGHGVGLCQKGADQMGVEGHPYREILSFYFPGTTIGASARGFAWRELSGENVKLLSLQPDIDRPVLAIAERHAADIASATGLPTPHPIEIRVYPDVESFRNATGEPGWVAGRTAGRRIELQPTITLRSRGALESTVRHELVHTFLETQAVTGLPVWFREGLAEYLSGGPKTAPGMNLPDRDLAQRESQPRARAADNSALARVTGLIQRYGLVAVIAWLKTGLAPGP